MTNKELIGAWGNKQKREAFLKDYKSWGVRLKVPEFELVFYSYVMPDGTEILSVEYPSYCYGGYDKGYSWETNNWFYVIKSGDRFSLSNHSNLWHVADVLKDAKVALQKQEKDGTAE